MVFRVRKSLRLRHYDYSQSGYYFVTICCLKMSFGNIANVRMQLNGKGEIARDFWLEIPARYPAVAIDEFVVMPGHIHGIVVINNDNDYVRANSVRPYGLLSRIVKMYKWAVTRLIHENGDSAFRWQRSFHDRIIRNERELNQIREYIRNNPWQWELDK